MAAPAPFFAKLAKRPTWSTLIDWYKKEEPSSSDLEEAMFGTRESCSASARVPIESNVPSQKSRTLSGSGPLELRGWGVPCLVALTLLPRFRETLGTHDTLG
eukprot:6409828-Amphidinium_carterae.1